ncbi:MAG: hypothetical protein ACM3ZE_01835 [Myxococcales bacterium]
MKQSCQQVREALNLSDHIVPCQMGGCPAVVATCCCSESVIPSDPFHPSAAFCGAGHRVVAPLQSPLVAAMTGVEWLLPSERSFLASTDLGGASGRDAGASGRGGGQLVRK